MGIGDVLRLVFGSRQQDATQAERDEARAMFGRELARIQSAVRSRDAELNGVFSDLSRERKAP